MDFMRARTREQINSRQEEIINACDELFGQYGYEGVNFKAISEMTSFTRPSIYNYYHTKDEVLLDLLKREMLNWQDCLAEVTKTTQKMTKEQYSTYLTEILVSHEKMLKLLSILFTFLENNSSVEKLAEFKMEVGKVLETIALSVDQYFPEGTDANKEIFVTALFAFVLGLYPMTHLTKKQQEAMEMVGAVYAEPDFSVMCYEGILLLLSGL